MEQTGKHNRQTHFIARTDLRGSRMSCAANDVVHRCARANITLLQCLIWSTLYLEERWMKGIHTLRWTRVLIRNSNGRAMHQFRNFATTVIYLDCPDVVWTLVRVRFHPLKTEVDTLTGTQLHGVVNITNMVALSLSPHFHDIHLRMKFASYANSASTQIPWSLTSRVANTVEGVLSRLSASDKTCKQNWLESTVKRTLVVTKAVVGYYSFCAQWGLRWPTHRSCSPLE